MTSPSDGAGGAVRERPIIFTDANVLAIMAMRKNQTRRVLKPQPERFVVDDAGTLCDVGLLHVEGDLWPRITTGRVVTRQEVRFAVGRRLWVRETWCHTGQGVWSVGQASLAVDGHVIYRANDDGSDPGIKWFSPIHMPRWASRLTLAVADVRVQRLQDTSEADAIAEGMTAFDFAFAADRRRGTGEQTTFAAAYRDLWNSIHGPAAWDANPWVAAITFEVTSRPSPQPSAGPADAGVRS